MKFFSCVLLITMVLGFAYGDAVGVDVYFEGWDGGTTAGWEPTNSASAVTAASSGGNPGGYLAIGGESNASVWIGALTTLPDATGDYWTSGVGVATLDLQFVSGSHLQVMLRFSGAGGASDGWLFSIRGPFETGDSWKQFVVEINSLWTDEDARNAGWIKEQDALGFHETMADVHSVGIQVLAVGPADVRLDNFRLGPPLECLNDLPTPVLAFKGKRIVGDFMIKWEFEVLNWEDYPQEMFVPSPLEPPCGSNKAAPRTKVRFFLSRGTGIVGLCDVTEPSQLQDIGFTEDLSGAPKIYIELRDRRCGQVLRSNTVSTESHNERPNAHAGTDQTVNCAGDLTPVALDGSMSDDPDGDDITYEWIARGITIDDRAAPKTTAYFPRGQHTVTLKVADGLSTDYDAVDLVVKDDSPPDLQVELDRTVLWPPNFRFVEIHATVTALDACEGESTAILSGIYSSEPIPPFLQKWFSFVRGADFGTLDTDFELRAARRPWRDGRVYTIVYMAWDSQSHVVVDSSYVYVPRCHWGRPLASAGFGDNGRDLKSGASRFALVIPSSAARGSDPAVDATEIDVGDAWVGNSAGNLSPTSAYLGDVTGDGLDDCVLFYSAAETRALARAAEDAEDDVGFYYRDDAGGYYAVENIFDIGEPVAISLDDLRLVAGDKEVAFEDGPVLDSTAGDGTPTVASLDGAYPNPFNPSLHLAYSVPSPGSVSLSIFDVSGRLVRRLVSGVQPAGRHTAFWDSVDENGVRVPSGVYFVKFQFGSTSHTQKIVLLK